MLRFNWWVPQKNEDKQRVMRTIKSYAHKIRVCVTERKIGSDFIQTSRSYMNWFWHFSIYEIKNRKMTETILPYVWSQERI